MKGNALCFSKACIIRYTSNLNVTTAYLVENAALLALYVCFPPKFYS